jgi:hypothetical protein
MVKNGRFQQAIRSACHSEANVPIVGISKILCTFAADYNY